MSHRCRLAGITAVITKGVGTKAAMTMGYRELSSKLPPRSKRQLPWLLAASLLIATTPSGDVDSQEDFEEWQASERKAFEAFAEESEREFLRFLEQEWRQLQVFAGASRDVVPKPVSVPTYRVRADSTGPSGAAGEGSPAPLETSASRLRVPERGLPSPPPPRVAEVASPGPGIASARLYGSELEYRFDRQVLAVPRRATSKEEVRAFWETLSTTDHRLILEQAKVTQGELGLNDWGYLQLLSRVGEAIYGPSDDRASLFLWFMLCKSGYDARVAYSDQGVSILLPARQRLYEVPFVRLDGVQFYAVAGSSTGNIDGSLFACDAQYPGAEAALDMMLTGPPYFGGQVQSKTLTFSYRGEDFSLPVHMETGALEFYSDYPPTDLEVYFEAEPSGTAAESMEEELRRILKGKTVTESVGLLLRMVQTAFVYQVDREQFGKERTLFPEETLAFPYSDCEDRAILFSYLVRNTLGLEVIGLAYPGHVATGVALNPGLAGAHVEWKGKEYTICDPTYIYAGPGVGMPKFVGVTPKVIETAAW